MRHIKIRVSTDRVGSQVSKEIEVEDDCSELEIEEMAREVMLDLINWSWKEEIK